MKLKLTMKKKNLLRLRYKIFSNKDFFQMFSFTKNSKEAIIN